jgi:hypothetical protein
MTYPIYTSFVSSCKVQPDVFYPTITPQAKRDQLKGQDVIRVRSAYPRLAFRRDTGNMR